MPRIPYGLSGAVSRVSAGSLKRRSKIPVSGSNTEPLGVRASDLEPSPEDKRMEEEAQARYLAGRKAEWKRRQDGTRFVDQMIVTIKAGKGGDGCVAFNREKFRPHGPPSGGNGGRGGDVYIQAVQGLSSLDGVPNRIRAENGGHGRGTWQHGTEGKPTVIKVPVGTVVQELRDAKYRLPTPEEVELQRLADLGIEDTEEMRIKRERDRKWVHYPTWEDSNIRRDDFRAADAAIKREEATQKRLKAMDKKRKGTLVFDLDEPHPPNNPDPGILVAKGGLGGFGNPFFLSKDTPSPKWATRGNLGDWITLKLELKIVADIGLVGLPNAGKSTLLRALTNSKAEVASYAFTTLNPQVGTVRMWNDGNATIKEGRVIEESQKEREKEEEALRSGEYAYGRPKEQAKSHQESLVPRDRAHESLRFKIADNPGLIGGAAENRGLGHLFLKSVERAPVLVYVVDLSAPSPWDDLLTVRDELEAYKPGLSAKARMVLANKADALAAGTEEEVAQAKEKLARLKDTAREMWERGPNVGGRNLDVIAASAKYTQNMTKVVNLLASYVETSRAENRRIRSPRIESVV
ncbi:GTP-binding protein Obg/CgtA [Serendipita vermifera]|nr:GTP-binding protein Obg/CgtA [Serendipita vermifera]